jgi:hypothetical protein
MEILFAKRQEALAKAADREAKGFTYGAKHYRRKAAGYLGAYNQLAKTL